VTTWRLKTPETRSSGDSVMVVVANSLAVVSALADQSSEPSTRTPPRLGSGARYIWLTYPIAISPVSMRARSKLDPALAL
jgi:hypothetical protein